MVTGSALVGILGTLFAQQALKKLQVSQGYELWIVDCELWIVNCALWSLYYCDLFDCSCGQT